MDNCSGCRMVAVIFGSSHCAAATCIKKKDHRKITTATIHFTAKLNLNSPLWPEGMTDIEKLQGWLFAARQEPEVAMKCLDFEITGEIDDSH